jgi:mannose-6-phosphate isomerase-like protein (cupin superfamily)
MKDRVIALHSFHDFALPFGGIMQSTASKRAAIFQPDQGKTFSFLGNITTCKFNPGDRGWQFYELLVTEGNPVPLHSHPWDEIDYLLEGEIDFQIGDVKVLATPGYFINLPAGIAHAFTVRSPQAKLLVGVSNEIAARFMEDLDRAEREQPLTIEAAMAIAQKHNLKIIP